MKVLVKVGGTSPLLMNRFTDEAQESATSAVRASTHGERLSPREDAESRLYRSDEGVIGLPQPNLLRAFIDAGKFFKNGKSKVTTQKSSIVTSALFIDQVFLPLVGADDWKVDSRPVRIPNGGGRIVRHRPCFDKWGLEFELDIEPAILSLRLTRDLLDAAGKRIGLGDFRPDCKGMFGKFEVLSWKESKS